VGRMGSLAAPYLLPLLAALASPAAEARSQAVDVDAAYFRELVHPILEASCVRCHGGGDRVRANLWLTAREGLVRGGDSGPALHVDEPGRSLLLRMVRWADELHQMPPDGRLPDDELAILERWIAGGAPYDPELEAELPDDEPDGPSLSRHDDGRAGWAYSALAAPEVPSVASSGPEHPIDAFVDARLRAAGLEPNPEADRVTLIRRATYDLTGLPPTPAEVRAFVTDESPEAWERLIDRLLASPAYGEKQGRTWLDLVRYAETNGFERDADKPFIWRYRDWVIDALNADLPFDRFCLEQLCGDELRDASPETRIATGYYRLPQWDDEPPQGALQARYDVLDDIARTTSEVFLGTTIGCARCHDHPADPIPQQDYYSFVAFFDGLTDMSVDDYVTVEMTDAELADWSRREAERAARERASSTEVDRLVTDVRERLVAHDGGHGPADLTNVRYRTYALPPASERSAPPPDFDALAPLASGALEGGRLDLLAVPAGEGHGVVFEATLHVPADGEYRFRLGTASAARVAVQRRMVVEGGHVSSLSEPIFLRAGEHPLRVDHAHRTQRPDLQVAWRRVDNERWLTTEQDPGAGWTAPDYDASGWGVGGPSFGQASPHAQGETPWETESIWLRRTFEWNEPADALGLVVLHDDDVEVWINGVPALELAGYVTEYRVHPVSGEARAALVAGENVIAVRCRQDFGGQYVHVAPVDLRSAWAVPPRDLAQGWRPLTRHDGRYGTPAAAELVRPRLADVLDADERPHFDATVAALAEVYEREIPKKRAATVQERAEISDLHVHVRGNPNVPGDAVEPRFPSAFTERTDAAPSFPDPPDGVASSGRRRALAEWIVTTPLFARVLANRVWQAHFGRGLVRSPNDFGELGDRPTHPELLDWLAWTARERGFRLKDLHRLVMTSAAYRRSSAPADAGLERDPANDLFWRFDRRRLTAEELRDAMLRAAGVLNRERGGPPFFARVSKEELATSSTPDQVWGTSPLEETNRRSIYAKVKRSLRPATLQDFDAADTDASCPVRFETVQPSQALGLLNGAFAREMATELAERVAAEAGDGGIARAIARALELALGRLAREDEVERLVALHAELQADFELSAHEALADVGLVVFNLNEFLYLD